jgi:cation:H+ antiporter
MVVVWLLGLIVGIVVASVASRRAVGHALDVTDALGVSPGLVGVTVMAVGTDLPEIANSIMASLSGHGDLNVGDSTGSALTQVTLILAILLLAAGSLDLRGRSDDEVPIAVPVGLMTVGALLVLAMLLADGRLQRWNGAVLVAGWAVSVWWMGRREAGPSGRAGVPGEAGAAAVRAIGWLAVVGVAATVTVRSFIELTDAIGVPEFVASSVILALGTSMPELVVDWTAIRRGAAGLAIGDLFGSSLVDATLSVGIGPLVASTVVSPETVIGTLVIAVGVAVTTVVVAFGRDRRQLAGGLLVVYLASTAALVMLAD